MYKVASKLILKKSLWQNFLRWESKQDAVRKSKLTKVEIDESRN